MASRRLQCTFVFSVSLAGCLLTQIAIAFQDAPAKSESEDPSLDWPQWRGPNRDNISLEKGLLKEWPDSGPPLLWRAEGIGRGIASVAVAEGAIFTIGYHFPGPNQEIDDSQNRSRLPQPRRAAFDRRRGVPQGEYLMSLDATSGELRWATRIGNAVFENHVMRWLSQRTPTVDEGRVFIVTAGGELVCISTADGAELWRRNYEKEFQGSKGWWGFCDYPLVDGDRLVCVPGGNDATIVALNKASGELEWKCAIPDAEGNVYAATIPCVLGGIRQYVACFDGGLVGVSAEEGKLLWQFARSYNHVYTLTPLVVNNSLLCCNGYRGQGVCRLQFRRVGDEIQVEDIGSNGLPGNVINYFQDNTLFVGDRLFSSGAPSPSNLVCIDADQLQVSWRQTVVADRSVRRGMIGFTYADERLYVRNSDGLVALVDALASEYRQLGVFTIPDAERSIGVTMPVVAGGRLYLRDDERLFCYDVRETTKQHSEQAVVQIDLSRVVDEPNDKSDLGDSIRSVFVPTPRDIVQNMLELAGVGPDDELCDLGSGDGRIVIEAAKRHGCTAIGYEIDSDLINKSRVSAKAAGVSGQTTFIESDISEADLSGVTVVTLYLLPEQNRQLLPQLERLPPGSRIVAHQNPIPDVRPDRVVRLSSDEDASLHTLYLWTTPLTTITATGR